MPIRYTSEPDNEGKRWIACDACDFRRHTHIPRERWRHRCRSDGPGWHLHQILKAAGATPDHRCSCKERALAMDDWGVDGCRQHRDVIIKWMKEAAFSRWFNEQARIGWALIREPWFNPLDPFISIVDEAIRRAEDSAASAADDSRPPE